MVRVSGLHLTSMTSFRVLIRIDSLHFAVIASSRPWLFSIAVHVYHMNNRRKTIITRYYHEMDGHARPIRVLANVRRKFWITKRAAQIKSESTGCYKCRLVCPRPCEQIMIPLSASRMYAEGYPFQVLGLVY